jgi:hypothetical protein
MAADEASKVDEIRTKEAATAVNIMTQEQEDRKYKSEPAEKTTFKHYTVGIRFCDRDESGLIGMRSIADF